jgi:hypothetical protein
MRYLASYFRIGRPSGLFIVSLAGIAALAAWLGDAALRAEGGAATGYALAFALVLLAFIEHGFLVVPWQDTRLFRWAMRKDRGEANRDRVAIADFNNIGGTTSAESPARRVSNPLAARSGARQ